MSGNIVTVISPVTASQYVEIASGNRAAIAYLLALIARDHRTPLVVIDGNREMPACQFIAEVYGTGNVMMPMITRPAPPAAPAAAPEIDYEHQLAAMC